MDNSTYNEVMMLYLDGELHGAEKEAFEKQLAADPSLHEELEHLRVAKESVRLLGLKQEVAAIHTTMMAELQAGGKTGAQPAPIRKMVRYSLALAASLLILIIGIRGYQYFTVSPDALFKEQYSTFELSSVRGNDAVTSAIETTYRDKNYTKVVSLSHEADSLPVKDIFLTGIAYMENGDYANGIETFKKISATDSNSIFKDAADYYLGLAYLKTKEYSQALQQLQVIRDNPTHLYHDKVSANLIRQVKMLK